MTLMRNIPASGSPPDVPPYRATEPPVEPPVFRFQIRRSLRIHRRLALAVALLVFAALVGAHFLMPRKYTAQSLVYIQPEVPALVGPQPPVWSQSSLSYNTFMQQQVQAVTRPDILQAAVASVPPGVWRQPGESLQMAAFRLGKSVQASRQGTSYQIAISLTGTNPKDVAQMVNALTATFLAASRRDELAGSNTRIKILREERTRIKDALNSDMAEKANLAKQLGVSNPTPGPVLGDPWTTQLNTLQAQLAAARDAHDQAAAELTALVSKNGLNSPALAAAAQQIIQSDSGLNSLKTSLNVRRAALISQLSNLAPANPIWQQDQAELKQINRSLQTMTASLQARAAQRLDQTLRTNLAKTAATEAELNRQLNTLTAQATTAAPKLERASDLTTDITRLQQRYTTIDDSLRNLELEASAPGSMHLSSPAQVPLIPDGGLRHKLLLLALPLALFCGLLAAVLATVLDRRIYTPSDVEHLLGFPPMALLPAPGGVPAPVRDEFVLRLAAAIAHAAATSSAHTWVITSAGDIDVGEIISELVAMLERLGTRTLSITSSRLLESREAAAHGPIASGTSPFGGAGMADQNLRRLRTSWDLILVETPPILLSGAAEYLARFADATLVVVESGATASADLRRAARLLERIHAPGVAALIAGISRKTADPEFLADLKAIEERLASEPDLAFAASASRPILRNPEVEVQLPDRGATHRSDKFTVSDRNQPAHPAPIVEAITRAVEALATAVPAAPTASQPPSPQPPPARDSQPPRQSPPQPATRPGPAKTAKPPATDESQWENRASASPAAAKPQPAEVSGAVASLKAASPSSAPQHSTKQQQVPQQETAEHESMDKLLDRLLSAAESSSRQSAAPSAIQNPAFAAEAAPPTPAVSAEPVQRIIHPARPVESRPFTPPEIEWQTQEITDPKAFPPRRPPAEAPTWLRAQSELPASPERKSNPPSAQPAPPPPPMSEAAPPADRKRFSPPPIEWEPIEVTDPRAHRRTPPDAPAWLQTQTFIELPAADTPLSATPDDLDAAPVPERRRPSTPSFIPSDIASSRVSRPLSSPSRRTSGFDLTPDMAEDQQFDAAPGPQPAEPSLAPVPDPQWLKPQPAKSAWTEVPALQPAATIPEKAIQPPREEIYIPPVPSHQPDQAVPETAETTVADQPHTHRRLGDYLFGQVVQTDGDLNILPPTMPGQYRIRRRHK